MEKHSHRLTIKQQNNLNNLMHNLCITQTSIAQKNKLKTSTTISQFCRGEYGATPRMQHYFKVGGIDLDLILYSDKDIEREEIPFISKNRFLTEEERRILQNEISKKGLTQSYIAKANCTSISIINGICKGRYRVSELMQFFFENVGIDLKAIMGKV